MEVGPPQTLRPSPLRRWLRRLAVLALYGCALCVVWFFVVAPLRPSPGSGSADAATRTQPARPHALPKRIPAWAWDLLKWQESGERGARPKAAPKRLPAWYASWKAWRLRAGGS